MSSMMLWNFEEALNSESESFGNNSSSGSVETSRDPLSLLLSSMAPPQHDSNYDKFIDDTLTVPDIALHLNKDPNVKCTICSESYRQPKVLACFHSFCKNCLEQQLKIDANNGRHIVCPQCGVETQLSAQLGIDGLLSDYGLENAVNALSRATASICFDEKSFGFSSNGESEGHQIAEQPKPTVICTGCKSVEVATAYCVDCNHHLCANCSMAHRFMNIFEGHRVEPYDGKNEKKLSSTQSGSDCKCLEHRSQSLCFFCISCNLAICHDCTVTEHCPPVHQIEPIDNVAEKQIRSMESLMNEARKKQSDLLEIFRQLDAGQNRLNLSFQQAKNTIDETINCLFQIIQDSQKSLYKELENTFGYKQLQLTIIDKEVQKVTKKMAQTIEFTQRLLKYSSPTEVMVFKPLLDARLHGFLSFNADANSLLHSSCEMIDTNSLNLLQARQTIFTLLNSLKTDSWQTQGLGGRMHSPDHNIHRHSGLPLGRSLGTGTYQISPPQLDSGFVSDLNITHSKNDFELGTQSGNLLGNSVQSSGYISSAAISINQSSYNSGIGLPIGTSAPASGNINSSYGTSPSNNIFGNYDKWSNVGGIDSEITDLSVLINKDNNGTNNSNFGLFPPRSQIKRQKMTYHCKFGEFGVMEGQFTEPSGVAVNAQNDIVVADTNNHRIQVFDKEGRFKFQFGECGKRDGQLLYPNRVAVNRVTGDFVVTERSPTHQIQIYNQYGHFLRKFGANILQHPRGVCVDHQGRIIVVECKVMRVLIFDSYGNILQKFSCSRYLEFPNGVCATDRNEILISDNRAHCIKVFSFDGQYLRQIGGEGITNYPIGVGINSHGEIVVADNHNNFNLTIFSQDGTLISALESKVKHAQCFDAALIDDGSMVLASKDYRLYIYRYQQLGT